MSSTYDFPSDNGPEDSAEDDIRHETKMVYVKRWRTLVRLPAKYADEIVAALRIPDDAQSVKVTPITMQDVRLMAGEGKLFPADVLNAVNVILKQRAERPVHRSSAATEVEPQWWKMLADNWRGRNGNTVTGDSVRNSCADELEKVAAKHHRAVPQSSGVQAERDRCVAICEGWMERFEGTEIQYTSPREYACDAIDDIMDLIRDGVDPSSQLTRPQHSTGEVK